MTGPLKRTLREARDLRDAYEWGRRGKARRGRAVRFPEFRAGDWGAVAFIGVTGPRVAGPGSYWKEIGTWSRTHIDWRCRAAGLAWRGWRRGGCWRRRWR